MKVLIIFTGGTISMANNQEAGGDVPTLSGKDILSRTPRNSRIADIVIDDFLKSPSPHMTVETMWQLRSRIQAWMEQTDIDGVVVTHGTDTMEETSYLLDSSYQWPKPLVFTGAMRSSDQLGYDGPANLVDSLLVCQELIGKPVGVVIVNQGKIFSGQQLYKSHSSNLDTFVGLAGGAIGVVDDHRVFINQHISKATVLEPVFPETQVDLIKAVAGMDDRYIECSINNGAKGIVIEAFGRGNVPPGILPGIKKAKEKGIPVVIVSRCIEGRVAPSYGYIGGGKDLEKYGVIFGGSLTGQQARLRLMLALGLTKDASDIQDYFLGS